jgi:cell wall-associated NlpC family hydrolase
MPRSRSLLGVSVIVLLPFALVAVLCVVVVGIAAATPSVPQLASGSVPAQLAGYFQQAGTACKDVSPALLAAQAYQESALNADARSPAGAIGIAQFMPSTWPHWTSPKDGDGKENPLVPADAIPAMARYDCALARQVAGRIPGNVQRNMLAAYNAGLGAVERADGIPPFAQTQNYVSNIMRLEPSFEATSGTVAASTPAIGAIAFAYSKLGTPYLWGGNGPGGFDCSGLTKAAYASVGVTIARVANEQWYDGPHVPKDQLQPGDLVFFAYDLNDPETIHHVGIYVGNGEMVNAPDFGEPVRVEPLDSDYAWGRRLGG